MINFTQNAPVTTIKNGQIFSKLKNLKNYLQSIITNNFGKDI